MGLLSQERSATEIAELAQQEPVTLELKDATANAMVGSPVLQLNIVEMASRMVLRSAMEPMEFPFTTLALHLVD